MGLRDYEPVWRQMQAFTAARDDTTPDELWLLQHSPVYTQGQAGKPEHILDPGPIPVINIDRGGQVTYHGPGQLVVYTLLDLARQRLGVRQLVSGLEQSVVDLLATFDIPAAADSKAPGVYVEGRKIASLGIRVRRGRCYHGLSLNVDMDLRPFLGINPCGHPSLEVTQLRDLGIEMSVETAADTLLPHLCRHLGYRISETGYH